MENCIKLRINAGNKDATNDQDKAIADAYGSKFIIPLDFEMLDSAAPYYQAGLGSRLCYQITFNDHNRVTKSTVSSPKVPDAKYKITDTSLEYEIVTQPDLARSIRSEYQSMVLLYDRILRHRQNTKVWSCCMTEFSDIDSSRCSRDLSGLNTKVWSCCMTEFSDIDRIPKYGPVV